MKKVQTSKKILTPADKTSSMYRLNKNEYQILLRNAFTKTYMKIQIKTLDKNQQIRYQVRKTGSYITQD